MSKTSGGYDINGDVTPFSHEPIHAVDASKWGTASITELWEQMSTLNARYITVAQMGRIEYMTPLKQAMAELEAIIKIRSQNNDKMITS